MAWLALDIGGANLKAADGLGFAAAVPLPLWRQHEQLPAALGDLLAASPACEQIAVTMTGELADCFATKGDGVRTILDAVERAADGRPVSVYLTDGRLIPPDAARAVPMLAAASNWHALAQYACRFCDNRSGLLIDIGSTTCDLVPLVAEKPAPAGRTDPERLVAGELVYTGIERSPLCAIVRHLPWKGKRCPVAQELFATTADVYLLLGRLPEDANRTDTADGWPRTKPHAHARLARTICADTTMFSLEEAALAAETVRDVQLSQLETAVRNVLGRMPIPPATVVLGGHGEFLARELLDRLEMRAEVISLNEQLGAEVSRCGPAHALAVIARETACGAPPC